MIIYRYRATLPQSKVFYRIYEVKSNMTLFAFNSFILADLEFAPDQIVMFEGCDAEGYLCSEYGMFDTGDGTMDCVTFEDTLKKGEPILNYIYDISDDRYIRLEFIDEVKFMPMRSYPHNSEGKGHNPDQFSSHYEDIVEYREDIEEKPEEVLDTEDLPICDE